MAPVIRGSACFHRKTNWELSIGNWSLENRTKSSSGFINPPIANFQLGRRVASFAITTWKVMGRASLFHRKGTKEQRIKGTKANLILISGL